jgi:2,3-bisphosphoglycerate-dependent phosphoglycerate mutase
VARVLLIRHCESLGPAPEAPLSERGREQAQALADFLAAHSIDRVVSSPYLRARQTIEPFAARAGLEIGVDARLRERGVVHDPGGEWREIVRASFADLEHPAPGWESAREAVGRGRAALDAALAAGDQLRVLVTHGQLMSLVLQTLDPSFGYDGWRSLSNPDVYEVERTADGAHRFARLWV